MENLGSILVGVDFSDSSVNAVKEAGRLAQIHRADLHVVHTVTPEFIERYRESSSSDKSEIIGKIRAQVNTFTRTNLGADQEFSADVFVGHPLDELARAVSECHADLLVLGSHGLTVDAHSIGNVASKCVRKAPAPVLLVRDRHLGAFRQVVAAVDFSDTSFLALKQAALLADGDGAHLHVLHVHCPPWMWVNYYAYDLKTFPKNDYENEYRAILRDQMEAFVAPLREQLPDLEMSTEVIEHDAYLRSIREFLSKVSADLLVIGTRGHSTIKSLLLGTTAERLLHDSPCSVLTVKPEGFKFKL